MKWKEIIELKENKEELSKFIHKEGVEAYNKAMKETIKGIIKDLDDLYDENLCNRYVTWDASYFKSTIRKCLPFFIYHLYRCEEEKLQEKGDGQYEEYQNALKAEESIRNDIISYCDNNGKGVFNFFDNFEISILRERDETVDGQFDIAHTKGSNLMLFRVCEWCREEYQIVLREALNRADKAKWEKKVNR